jgi:hypothetical protein
MLEKMIKNTEDFITELKRSREPLTFDSVDQLLSAQNRSNQNSFTDTDNIKSLGKFLTEQSQIACEAAIDISKTIDGRYFGNVIRVNKSSQAFIEAESQLRVKGSLFGQEHIDTYRSSQTAQQKGKGKLSILPYLRGGLDGTVADLDQIICMVSEETFSQRALSMRETGVAETMEDGLRKTITIAARSLARGAIRATKLAFLYVAPIIDAALFFPRLALNPVLSVVRFLPLPEDIQNKIDAITQFNFSIAAKKIWHEQYKRLNKDGKPEKNDHQDLLDCFKETKYTSPFDRFFTLYSPKAIHAMGVKLYHERTNPKPVQITKNKETVSPSEPNWYLPTKTRTAAFVRSFYDSRKPEEVYNLHKKNYKEMQPIVAWLKKQAQKTEDQLKAGQTVDTIYSGIVHQRKNKIDSPTRVVSDVLYIFNEHVVNHLADTMPGPSAFFFLVTLASFGSNFMPISGVAGLHAITLATQQLAKITGKAFIGYSGSMASTQGFAANVLLFKLANLAALTAISASDKNNTFLEDLANNPEKVLATFIACVGVGIALGHLPEVPPLPINLPLLGTQNANIYGQVINMLIEASKMTQEGTIAACAEDLFLGYKSIMITHDLSKQGKAPFKEDKIREFVRACNNAKFFDEVDLTKRTKKMENILDNFKVEEKATRAYYIEAMEAIYANKSLVNHAVQAAAKELNHNNFCENSNPHSPSKESSDPYTQLKEAIDMVADPDAPITFNPEQRDDAIKFYNHLSHLFDKYNQMADENNLLLIPKEDFLLAFRNKNCPTGRHIGAGVVRLLSAYPLLLPFRALARTAQKRMYRNSPFVQDTIKARREEDIALWREWPAALLQSGYSFSNITYKATIKPLIWGARFAYFSIIEKLFYDAHSSLEIIAEREGRWVNEHIRFQVVVDALANTKAYAALGRLYRGMSLSTINLGNIRARTAMAAHHASNYDEVGEAAAVIIKRLEKNKENPKLRTLELLNKSNIIRKKPDAAKELTHVTLPGDELDKKHGPRGFI